MTLLILETDCTRFIYYPMFVSLCSQESIRIGVSMLEILLNTKKPRVELPFPPSYFLYEIKLKVGPHLLCSMKKNKRLWRTSPSHIYKL